jgi:ankyrin repeat protein
MHTNSGVVRIGFAALALLLAVPVTTAASDLRLVDAAAKRDTRAIQALLKEGVDVNTPRADGVTAILWAAHWNDLDTIELLVRAGANVNAADDHGVTPLIRACENAEVATVEKLLAAGANVNTAQTNGVTPLLMAARTGNVMVVKALLARGAKVNAATRGTEQTPLMWAAAEGHLEVVRTLVENGADVHASSDRGFTPLLHAARNGDIEMARVLIAAGVNVNETGGDGTHALPLAIISGQDKFALFLLEQGADPNGAIYGVRALHAAAGSVEMWIRDWLRIRGVDRQRSVTEFEPSRRLPLVKALLARGADPNARITQSAVVMNYLAEPRKGAFEPFSIGTGDVRGATPLWVAAFSANAGRGNFGTLDAADSGPDIIKELLAAGADHRLTTDDGTTVLMAAAGIGHSTYQPRKPRGDRSPSAEEAVKILVETGAEINAVNEADFTALHGAAFRGLNEVVEYLVAHGADINARDFRGRTPFRIAEGAKQSFQFQDWPETAELLRKLGANTALGIPGTVQERQRDITGAADGGPQ